MLGGAPYGYRVSEMIAEGFLWLARRAPAMRRVLWGILFDLLAARLTMEWWTFMNYGYHDAESTLPLVPADLDNRYAIQLYERVIDGLTLDGLDVLEIGCGRGGGAAAAARYWRPKRIVGLDLSRRAIAFCRRVHRGDALSFVRGSAEALPFPDDSFDVAINVESSFCYGSFERFLAEVRRVLKPGGHFLFADIRLIEERPELDAALASSGLDLLRSADITAHIVTALSLDAARRRAASRGLMRWPAQQWLDTFVGIAGTRIPIALASGRMVYVCHKYREPVERAATSAPSDMRAESSLEFSA